MILILLVVVLCVLKFFEISFMQQVSWWWIVGIFAVTFIWFEVFERLLGLDKKKLHESFNALQQRRTKKTFDEKR